MLSVIKRAFTPATSVRFPDPAEVKWAIDRHPYTPDAVDLEEQEFNLLFVADDCQRRLPRYNMIEDGAFLCNAYTRPYYDFWAKNVGPDSYPVPLRSKVQTVDKALFLPTNSVFAPHAKIAGELHLVRSSVLFGLDKHRRNGVEFKRTRIEVLVPYRRVKRIQDRLDEYAKTITKEGEITFRLVNRSESKIVTSSESVHKEKVWFYEGCPDYWEPLLDAGYTFSPVGTHTAKNKAWLTHYYLYR